MENPQLRSPKKIYAVEISGVCNLESFCKHCPMHNRPRSRKRGLMSDEIVERALYYVSKLDKEVPLALHVFGEPLLHPKFIEIAKKFSQLTRVTFSTNATYLDEAYANRLVGIPWAWVSLSPWDRNAVRRAIPLLLMRNIPLMIAPGITHDFASQAIGPTQEKVIQGCPFLKDDMAVIRWDGSIATCCISDREEDVIGHVNQEPEEIKIRAYSICDSCHLR